MTAMTTTATRAVRAAVGAALAAGLLLAAPSAAFADAPERETIEFDYSEEVPDFAECGVTAVFTEVGTLEVTTWVDGEEPYDRRLVKVRSELTITSDFGTVTETYVLNKSYDPSEDTSAASGSARASGPQGRLDINAGRATGEYPGFGNRDDFTTFTGVNTSVNGGLERLCAVLTGEDQG